MKSKINVEDLKMVYDAIYLVAEIEATVPDADFEDTILAFNAEEIRNILISLIKYVKDTNKYIDVFTISEFIKAERNSSESSAHVH